MNKYYEDKVVIITGGSSGIGLALAKEFRKQGAQLTIVARDAQKLARAKDELLTIANGLGNVDVAIADVADKNQITTAINAVGMKYGKINVLINCAGIASCGRFKDVAIEELSKCVMVNYMGAVLASKAAWPFLAVVKGQLSFVSSVAGYLGLIGYSSYAPTKFAMTGLAECLLFEGKDDGIRVSIIYPPDTETPLLQYEKTHTLPECKALSKNIKVKSADEVAVSYMKGLKSGKFQIYCDVESRFVRWFKNNFYGLFVYFTGRIIKASRKHW